MSAAPQIPPWIADGSPDNWVPLAVAARCYFRKSLQRVYQMRKEGTLDEVGIPTWFDGARWYCRLPVKLPARTVNPRP